MVYWDKSIVRKINFRDVTDEDLSYAILSNEAIDFGYITRKETRNFFSFLYEKNFLKKLKYCKNYEVMISFCYQTPKLKKTDEYLSVTHVHKMNTYIDYKMRETEFLESEE